MDIQESFTLVSFLCYSCRSLSTRSLLLLFLFLLDELVHPFVQRPPPRFALLTKLYIVPGTEASFAQSSVEKSFALFASAKPIADNIKSAQERHESDLPTRNSGDIGFRFARERGAGRVAGDPASDRVFRAVGSETGRGDGGADVEKHSRLDWDDVAVFAGDKPESLP